MNSMFNSPPALPLIYSTPEPNASVRLYSGDLTLSCNGHAMTGAGTVSMDWLPTPRLAFTFVPPLLTTRLGEVSISAPAWTARASGQITQSGSNGVKGFISGQFRTGDSTGLKHIIFHLVNSDEYAGSAIANETASWAGRAKYDTDNWLITVDGYSSFPGNLGELLKTVGGYGITHVGKLERKDGSCFSLREADDLFCALYFFFTFVRGLRVAPILRVGFGEDAERKCEDWTCYNTDQWLPSSNWCDPFLGGVESGFRGFYTRWSNPVWKAPLEVAIHWYAECNELPIYTEKGIILLQTAIESLAWTKLVEDEKSLSEDGFKKIPAYDKIRLLLTRCGIPLAIPNVLTELSNAAKGERWSDGPQAFTGVRNAVVHSSPAKRIVLAKLNGRASYEAWTLGMWYVELVLLRLFGYTGQYSNRTIDGKWRGTVEKVPWAVGLSH